MRTAQSHDREIFFDSERNGETRGGHGRVYKAKALLSIALCPPSSAIRIRVDMALSTPQVRYGCKPQTACQQLTFINQDRPVVIVSPPQIPPTEYASTFCTVH